MIIMTNMLVCVCVCLCMDWECWICGTMRVMECLHDYISLLFVFPASHPFATCTRMCVFVCVAQVGVHEQHTDEFPACADQITLPTLFLSLRLSFSQSCLLLLLYPASLSAGKQLRYSTEWCFCPAAVTVFQFLMTWEPCLVYRITIRCTFLYQLDLQLLKYTPYSLYTQYSC